MTPTERLGIVLTHLDRTQAFHGRVEGRVAVLLALNVAMATITVTNLPKSVLLTCMALPGFLSLALTAAAFVFLILVSYSHLATKLDPSLLYFGDIARLDSSEYVNRMKNVSVDDLLNDGICQIWRNAEIVDAKFKQTQRAFYCTCGAIIMWMLFLLIITIQTGGLPVLKS